MEADIKLKLEQLHQRVDSLKDQINTEEATKMHSSCPLFKF